MKDRRYRRVSFTVVILCLGRLKIAAYIRPKLSKAQNIWYCLQRHCASGKIILERFKSCKFEVMISLHSSCPVLSPFPHLKMWYQPMMAASRTGFDLCHQSAIPLMSGWHQTVDGPNLLRSFKSNNIIYPTRCNFWQAGCHKHRNTNQHNQIRQIRHRRA